jgi:hypothetical protein
MWGRVLDPARPSAALGSFLCIEPSSPPPASIYLCLPEPLRGLSFEELSLDEDCFEELSFDEPSFDELSLDEPSFEPLSDLALSSFLSFEDESFDDESLDDESLPDDPGDDDFFA